MVSEPLFLDSPAVAPHLPMPHPGRSDRNTLLHRLFDGGSLKFVRKSSAKRLNLNGTMTHNFTPFWNA
jgi:hypothetical protein